jgi:hypothetical protein
MMTRENQPARGFRLLDGLGLVLGAAVASAHLRIMMREAQGIGWIIAWIVFTGVALTAAGPFQVALCWLLGDFRSNPRLGLLLWGLLGTPWLLTAPLSPMAPETRHGAEAQSLYHQSLVGGVALASIIVLCVMWVRWVRRSSRIEPDTDHWIWQERLAWLLCICWPLQSGFVLLILA